ncbi:MAG: HAD hydrolase family protein, partial [Kineothrix sp.]|nr:HAD hydrolase family protein [Kineothrix sp.]
MFDHNINAIPESAYRGVELAKEAGHKIFICTGRSCCLLDHVKEIKYDGVVAAAGAYVRVGEKVIYEDVMTVEELQPALEYCLGKGASYVMEGKSGVYMHK